MQDLANQPPLSQRLWPRDTPTCLALRGYKEERGQSRLQTLCSHLAWLVPDGTDTAALCENTDCPFNPPSSAGTCPACQPQAGPSSPPPPLPAQPGDIDLPQLILEPPWPKPRSRPSCVTASPHLPGRGCSLQRGHRGDVLPQGEHQLLRAPVLQDHLLPLPHVLRGGDVGSLPHHLERNRTGRERRCRRQGAAGGTEGSAQTPFAPCTHPLGLLFAQRQLHRCLPLHSGQLLPHAAQRGFGMDGLQQLRQNQLFPSTYAQVWHCQVRELSQPSQ